MQKPLRWTVGAASTVFVISAVALSLRVTANETGPKVIDPGGGTPTSPVTPQTPSPVTHKGTRIITVAPPTALTPTTDAAYKSAIHATANMVNSAKAQQLAEQQGLDILNVTWEDMGRYKGSAVGPNISDMTIQVRRLDPKTRAFEVKAMPVIRHPNFVDKSADLDPRDFTLLVGNHAGKSLKRISLHDFLESPTRYLSKPASWKSARQNLLAPRDSKVLVSAQACFLPVPQRGKATFNPVLFNYQSVGGDPAVLTLLATREGTSVTVIDNKRDAFQSGSIWGQRLFHNVKGQRASLTGERESEFTAQQAKSMGAPAVSRKGKRESGLNMVLLIQIPLKQKQPLLLDSEVVYAPATPMAGAGTAARRSNVENAVIGHGDMEGPFTEIDGLSIERDVRYPVRVTIQFYKATSNGIVEAKDIREIKAQIDRVYAQSNFVGSLVTDGATGRQTEYEGVKIQPVSWWKQFWKRHQANTGQSRETSIQKLQQLLGTEWKYQYTLVSDLYLRDLLTKRQV
jgi:hypothetical protein